MKKLFLGIIVAGILSLTSCSDSTNSLLGGTWSMKGINYSAISAIGSTTASTLTATTGSTSEIDNVVFRFSSFPPAAGQYTIVGSASAGSLTSTQVYITTTIGTKIYTIATGGSGTATVTVSGSKISVSVPATNFTGLSDQTDAGTFTATINQNL